MPHTTPWFLHLIPKDEHGNVHPVDIAYLNFVRSILDPTGSYRDRTERAVLWIQVYGRWPSMRPEWAQMDAYGPFSDPST